MVKREKDPESMTQDFSFQKKKKNDYIKKVVRNMFYFFFLEKIQYRFISSFFFFLSKKKKSFLRSELLNWKIGDARQQMMRECNVGLENQFTSI